MKVAHNRKATNEEILSAYTETGNVHLAALRLGMCGQSVHERLVRLGANKNNFFTEAERAIFEAKYEIYASAGKLADLALQMGRTKTAICAFARKLGLTNQKRSKPYAAKWKYLTEDDARVLMDAFKRSRLGLGAYCKKMGYDDLGFAQLLKRHFPDEYEHVIEAKVPALSLYRRGRQFEYRVRDFFKARDYVVTRSPGSKSPIDLIAIGRERLFFIQCKRHGALNVKEWNELFALADSVAARPLLAAVAAGGRGIEFYEIIGMKDGSKRRQPMVPVAFDKNGNVKDEAPA